MAWLDVSEGQSISSKCKRTGRQRSAQQFSGGGPKGPPSAPPTIPPIIITPFSYQMPEPAIDPRITPLRPPIKPPSRPCVSCRAPEAGQLASRRDRGAMRRPPPPPLPRSARKKKPANSAGFSYWRSLNGSGRFLAAAARGEIDQAQAGQHHRVGFRLRHGGQDKAVVVGFHRIRRRVEGHAFEGRAGAGPSAEIQLVALVAVGADRRDGAGH